MIRRISMLAPALVLPAVLLAGCGSGKAAKSSATTGLTTTTVVAGVPGVVGVPGSPSGPTSTRTARATTTPAARATATTTTTATTNAAPTGTIQLADKYNRRTVVVGRGATIVVVLASTYWGFPTAPKASVLQPIGGVSIVASPPGTCVPGGGCGTASATYKAVGTGQATILALRTTCGEARLCSSAEGSYSVTVTVASPTG